jgi:hypothetical protein
MTTRHLGKRLSQLLDGRLNDEETLEAMAHLESCPACNEEWDDLRRDREALQTSGSGIDMRNAQKLLNRDRIAEIAQAEPRRHVKVAGGVRPHFMRATLLSTAGVTVVLALLYALGEPGVVSPDAFVAEAVHHGPDLRIVPSSSAADEVLAPWVHPEWGEGTIAPAQAVRTEANGVRVVRALVFVGDDELMVSEVKGQLPSEPTDPLVRVEHEARDVFQIEGEDSTIFFESEDAVVRLDCTCSLESLLAVADTFPESRDPGVFERLGQGVGAVANAVTGG